jgi:hypothetical protein
MRDLAGKIMSRLRDASALLNEHCKRHSDALEAGAGFAMIGGLFIAGAALPAML